MRILVTGSSGFVGGAVMAALSERGHEVQGFSRKPAPGSIGGDLLDPASVRSALAAFRPEVVFNLAGQTSLKGVPRDGFAANTVGVSNLMDAVREAPSVRRGIWMSSQLVGRPGVTPRYDTAYDPGDDYGRSKVEGEQIVRQHDGAGREWIIPRSTTIWGPGMSDHYANLLRLIERGLYFHVGRRPLLKSYSYIDNLADQLATLATADRGQVHRKTLYLADSEPIELRSWITGFAREFGRKVPTLPTPVARAAALAGDVAQLGGLPAPLTSRRLANMSAQYLYDTGPIEAIAGRSKVSNEEGVRRTAQWFKAQRAREGRETAMIAPAADMWPAREEAEASR